MKPHSDKCHVIHLGRTNPQKPCHLNTYSGDRHGFDEVTPEKDLGITTDQQLKVSDHRENSVKEANRVLGCIARNTPLSQQGDLPVAVHLEYSSCVWPPHLKKDQGLTEQGLKWLYSKQPKPGLMQEFVVDCAHALWMVHSTKRLVSLMLLKWFLSDSFIYFMYRMLNEHFE